MTLIELLTTARTLCRADGIRIVQYLVADLAPAFSTMDRSERMRHRARTWSC